MTRVVGLIFSLLGVGLGLPSCQFWRKPPADRPALLNADLDKKLGWMLRYDVPLIGVDSLAHIEPDVLVLDAREPREYAVAHVPGAVLFPPNEGLPNWLDTVPRERPVAVYCSVGYRSEQVARKLQGAGFTHVSNVYGSLFEYADRGLPLVDSAGVPTRTIHTYSEKWGTLLTSDSIIKVN